MRKKLLLIAVALLVLGVALTSYALRAGWVHVPQRPVVQVLEPKGEIAHKQRNLMIFSTLIMLIVVVPVFVMTFYISWTYRASNTKARYTPDWDHNRLMESIWWGLPTAIILVLAVVTYKSSHSLDPYRPITSSKRPVPVQVVALRWKWLFLYPEQGIATVNYVQFPEDTPVEFTITADAPMNSFWIPQLGGQVYAMSGMKTKLFLMADAAGEYKGVSANISGQGFAGMGFVAKSSTSESFYDWVQAVKQAPLTLNAREYTALAEPSENNPPAYFGAHDAKLYDTIIAKYMAHGHAANTSSTNTGGTRGVPSPFLNGHTHDSGDTDTVCETPGSCGGAL